MPWSPKAKPYKNGDINNIKPENASSTLWVGIGNILINPWLLLLKIAIINCTQPIVIGKNKEAPLKCSIPNNHGDAIDIKAVT